MDTSLRQATAKMTAVGIVSEKNLLEKMDEKGNRYIEGTVVIKTDETNFISYRVRCSEKKSNGDPNSVYAGIRTVMNEYKTIAQDGEDSADKVSVEGELNPFYSIKSGREFVGYKGSFFNRVTDINEYEPKAEFEVELYIQSMVWETTPDGNETGRLIIKGWMPTYNGGIEPLMLVAEQDIASGIESYLMPGQTSTFYGDAVNRKEVTITQLPVTLGKPREEKRTRYVNELLVTTFYGPYEEGSAKPPYDPSIIKMAIQERENRIEERKASPERIVNQKPSGANYGRKAASW